MTEAILTQMKHCNITKKGACVHVAYFGAGLDFLCSLMLSVINFYGVCLLVNISNEVLSHHTCCTKEKHAKYIFVLWECLDEGKHVLLHNF